MFLEYRWREIMVRPVHDPEDNELNHLVGACDLAGKDILEVGCGNGRFTRRYASLPRRIIGIDPVHADLQTARNENVLSASISFVRTMGEHLPFAAGTFDIAIFACAL